MKVFLIIFAITLFLLFFPINLKGKVSFNVFCNKGFVSFYFYKIPLYVANFSFVPFKILLNKNGKQTTIDLTKIRNSTKFGDIFFKRIIDIIKIKNFVIYATLGLFSPISTSIVCGGANASSLAILGALLNVKKFDNFQVQFMPSFLDNSLMFVATFSFSLNLFWLIFCAIQSLLLSVFFRYKKA